MDADTFEAIVAEFCERYPHDDPEVIRTWLSNALKGESEPLRAAGLLRLANPTPPPAWNGTPRNRAERRAAARRRAR